MIKVWEAVTLYKQSRRDWIEGLIKHNAKEGYMGYVTRKTNVPEWLQEELKEAGFTLLEDGIQINISWKIEV